MSRSSCDAGLATPYSYHKVSLSLRLHKYANLIKTAGFARRAFA